MKHSKILLWVLILLSYPVIAGSIGFAQVNRIPPSEDEVMARLNTSPRHGEWVSVKVGNGDTVDAWLVFPERSDNAPVVMVIHEIYGLTDWVRAVADQFAAEGFIAIAPDLLSGKGPGGKGSYAVGRDDARRLIRSLEWGEIVRRLDATARYATALPAATSRFGVVGYCWGGGISFNYATEQPDLNASVVYYGVSPSAGKLAGIKAPVLGLYGDDDSRVTSTVSAAEKEMKRLGKRYEYEIYKGAGHAFLRNQSVRGGANLKAAQMAWPRTIKFLKELLES
jgi:carboxymethylenebutenolidase